MSSIGLKLPITYNSNDGFTMIKTLATMIKQNFKMLILTIPGERVMEPTFGVGLSRYLFSNYSEDVEPQIRRAIEEQTETYLPVVAINNIAFNSLPDTNSLNMIISYTVPGLGISDLLRITI